MKLTTKGRYAVTAMLDLAVQQEVGSVCLSDIADRQAISLSYLEQLFARLRKCGLVQSTRGPGGGYSLGQPAQEISIVDIIEAVDEEIDITRCSGGKNCHQDMRCITHDLWSELSDQIKTYMQEVTLGQLVQRQSVRAIASRQSLEAISARQETILIKRREDLTAS